jgi:hypothetical protein
MGTEEKAERDRACVVAFCMPLGRFCVLRTICCSRMMAHRALARMGPALRGATARPLPSAMPMRPACRSMQTKRCVERKQREGCQWKS